MIYIYLCEDNKKQLEYWQQIITDYLLINPINAVIACAAQSPDALLNTLDLTQSGLRLYFLDICLETNKNGFQLASQIRKKDPLGEIVFVTSRSELTRLSFEYHIRALDFISKDNVNELPEKIRNCILATSEKEKQLNKLTSEPLYLKVNGERIYFNPDDIQYIETSSDAIHKIVIYTTSGMESIYGTLKEMEQVLKKYSCFFRCNKSTIVNRMHIKTTDRKGKQILLHSGITISVSLRYLRNASPPVSLS